MNIGIVGAGLIAKELLISSQNIPEINILALLARPESITKHQQLCNTYMIPHLYIDYDEMLRNPDIEIIYIAIPNHLHYEFSLRALKSGKHVICEKPFTITTDEAKSLKAAAIHNKRMIFEAISTIHLQNFVGIKKKP